MNKTITTVDRSLEWAAKVKAKDGALPHITPCTDWRLIRDQVADYKRLFGCDELTPVCILPADHPDSLFYRG